MGVGVPVGDPVGAAVGALVEKGPGGKSDRIIRIFAHQNSVTFPLQFCQNSGFFSQFFRNSENVETCQHLLEYSAKI